MSRALILVTLASLAATQTPGTAEEVHPKLQTFRCTVAGGCVEATNALVLDSSSHPIHRLNDTSKTCGNWGSPPDADACPDEETCASNCIMEGISDYAARGVTTDGTTMRLQQLSDDGSSTLSPRVYLLAEDEDSYEMMQLTGGEFSFDVDMSKLPCGMNAALYTVEMDETGARSELNPGGATYGTGYCDAQCFVTPFINGIGNVKGKGSCCNEMDIWEANMRATQIAPHTCNQTGLYMCEGAECQFNGVCDKNGCGQNPYRLGSKDYYGPNMTVNTLKPFTVVTQFHANDDGILTEIHRLYVQDGTVIPMPIVNVTGVGMTNLIDDDYCAATGATRYMDLGATEVMGESLSRGMVLAISIWWDAGGNMNWLDSGDAGPCNAEEGNPAEIIKVEPHPVVEFSNLKWGEIGSTYTCDEKKRSIRARW